MLALCAIDIRNVWTSDADLTQLKGNLQAVNTYVSTVTDRRGHTSQKSEMIFFLNDRKQKYQLTENIGDKYYDDKYEHILLCLKKQIPFPCG